MTGTIADTMPIAGRKMMYTSGWPKIQNKCCQRIGSPPPSWSNTWNPNARCSSSRMLAPVRAGIAKTTENAIARIAQQ